MGRITRRRFIRDGSVAVAVAHATPRFLSDAASAQVSAQSGGGRNLVVLYLQGGNDALSTVIPYTDAAYYARRPNIAVPATQVLQVGADTAGRAVGLHPRLTGLRALFTDGRMAIIQRAGYADSSRSHFEGTDIWGSADPANSGGLGWLGRYLDALPTPIDPLAAWNTTRETPRALVARSLGVPAIPDARAYSFASPNGAADAVFERQAALRMASNRAGDRSHLAFVDGTMAGAFGTMDRVGAVADYQGTVAYPTSALAISLRTVAGAIARGVGTRIYWVSTSGFDTHAAQGNAGAGGYANLMTGLNDALVAFTTDLKNQGLLGSTLVLQFSEFSRRITENGSQGTDHGAAGVMLAFGAVRGGLYGTAPSLAQVPDNPTLENDGADVRYETDFRAVYARVLDSWLGVDSRLILGDDFRGQGPAFI